MPVCDPVLAAVCNLVLSGKQNETLVITARAMMGNEKDPELYFVGRSININNPPAKLTGWRRNDTVLRLKFQQLPTLRKTCKGVPPWARFVA
jgi:hypothetical protein